MSPQLIPKNFEVDDKEKKLRKLADRTDEIRREGLHLLMTSPELRRLDDRRELMGRIDRKPWYYELPRLPIAEKIVFLNKENLQHLEGYKASVEIHEGKITAKGMRHEIHIVLTDFSLKCAKDLLDSLKAMNPKEVYGDNE